MAVFPPVYHSGCGNIWIWNGGDMDMPIEARQLPQIIANLCGSWDASEIFYCLIMQMRMSLTDEEAISGGESSGRRISGSYIYAWVYGQVDRPTIRYAGRRKTALKLRQDLPEFDNCGNADNLFLTARPLDLRPFPPLNPREPAPNCWPGQKDSSGLVLFLSRALSSIDNWIKSLGAKKISR